MHLGPWLVRIEARIASTGPDPGLTYPSRASELATLVQRTAVGPQLNDSDDIEFSEAQAKTK